DPSLNVSSPTTATRSPDAATAPMTGWPLMDERRLGARLAGIQESGAATIPPIRTVQSRSLANHSRRRSWQPRRTQKLQPSNAKATAIQPYQENKLLKRTQA